MNQHNLAIENNLGYVFTPGRRPSEPGYSRLDIALRDTPSEHHFDPSSVRAMVAHEQTVDYWTIEHAWSGEKSLRICAGPLDLADRKNKRVEIFSFGGQLAIEGQDTLTSIVFTSPAPILILRAVESVSSLLAQEAEILLAQRCAALESHPGEFDRRLIEVDPMVLYRSILHAVLARLEALPRNDIELWQQFQHMLKVETRILQDEFHNEPCQNLESIV